MIRIQLIVCLVCLSSVCAQDIQRVPWKDSRVVGTPDPPRPYEFVRVFPQLEFNQPVELVRAPGSDRLFVVELNGTIRSFVDQEEPTATDLFADLRKADPQTTRVYGLAFHPDYESNRLCYVCYIRKAKEPAGTRLVEFRTTDTEPARLIPDSGRLLLTWLSGGHNGGSLKFGPDGYLYISTGDAGPAFPPDPLLAGQDVSNLLSSILRIDVDQQQEPLPYAIPSDNPFVQLDGARGEVWAYGLRNPWRMNFDRSTGDLWVGDVGWELWEMIYRIRKGGNYGWSLTEGPQAVHQERTRGPTPILPPAIAHSHHESRSITGGFVYRGKALTELRGAYVYGDYVTGKVWAARFSKEDRPTWQQELAQSSIKVICFGESRDQELYIADYLSGGLFQLRKRSAVVANRSFPKRLSQTGLFRSVADHQPAAGVYPYDVNAKPWEDNTIAERWVAIPNMNRLGIHDATDRQRGILKGEWSFPTGTVFVKTISTVSPPQRIETQLLHLSEDGWRGYSYCWNNSQTDAELVPANGKEIRMPVHAGKQEGPSIYKIPGRNDCLLCHTPQGGFVYGFRPSQLDKQVQWKDQAINQLKLFESLELFEKRSKKSTRLVDPYAASEPLDDRARSYLHVNCSHCHQRGGGGTAHLELGRQLAADRMHMLNERPTQGTFGIFDAKVVAGGDPYRSVLYYRISKLGPGRMPHYGAQTVDRKGVSLIHEWINSLEAAESHSAVTRIRTQQTKQLDRLLAGGSSVSEDLKRLLQTPSGSMMLADAIHQRPQDQALREHVVSEVMDAPPSVRDLFEPLFPESLRRVRIGDRVNVDEILSMDADVQKGKQLFSQSALLQCKNCHRVGDVGKKLGPDLDGIGSRLDKVKLLESIIYPSKQIEPDYVPYLVETQDGEVFSGLVESRSAQEVVLRGADDRPIRISTDSIDLIVPQRKSLMPELLVRELTAQELADLVAYLWSLKEARPKD